MLHEITPPAYIPLIMISIFYILINHYKRRTEKNKREIPLVSDCFLSAAPLSCKYFPPYANQRVGMEIILHFSVVIDPGKNIAGIVAGDLYPLHINLVPYRFFLCFFIVFFSLNAFLPKIFRVKVHLSVFINGKLY